MHASGEPGWGRGHGINQIGSKVTPKAAAVPKVALSTPETRRGLGQSQSAESHSEASDFILTSWESQAGIQLATRLTGRMGVGRTHTFPMLFSPHILSAVPFLTISSISIHRPQDYKQLYNSYLDWIPPLLFSYT